MVRNHWATLGAALLMSSWVHAADTKHETNRHVESQECAECHEEIYEQWKGSMHAKSTALEDPIHGTFYRQVVGDPTAEGLTAKGKYPVCLQCHAPAAAKDGKTNLDAMPAYREGVNCVACHSLTHYKGVDKLGGGLQLGMAAYEFSDTSLQGPRGEKKKHGEYGSKGIVNNPAVSKTSAACLGCHDQRPNANKVPLCATGPEVRAAGGSTTCQNCHMPVIDGLADHSMMGGHSPEMVGRGIVITIDSKPVGDELDTTIEVTNLLPHNFPTGAPFRNFFIKVNAYNARGKELWSSTASHPIKDDQLAMMMYKLGDKGHPAPPPTATEVLGDSRLKPNEKRILHYRIPATDVASVEAVGYYDLLLPPIKEKVGDKVPSDLKKSQEVARAEVLL